MADTTSEQKKLNPFPIATLLAIVGTVITVLTLYYARKDKQKEQAENRPVVDIVQISLKKREMREDPNHSSYENDTLHVTVTNHGNRIAYRTTIDSVGITPVNLGEIGPGQTVSGDFWAWWP